MQRQTRLQDTGPSAGTAGAAVHDTITEMHIGLYYLFVEEVVQRGSMSAADRFLSSAFVAHNTAGDRDRDTFIFDLGLRRARYPGATWTIEALTGINGLVVCYMTMAAPNLAGPVWESLVVRFEGDKIAEIWSIGHQLLVAS